MNRPTFLAAVAVGAVLAGSVVAFGNRGSASPEAPTALETGDTPVPRARAVQAGIAVEMAVEALDPAAKGRPLRKGDEVSVTFALSDTGSGTPLLRAAPAGWIDMHRSGESIGEEACRTKAAAFIGGGLTGRAEIDLNESQLLVLNQDASISVVDPRFSFGGSRLLTMAQLRTPGADWALLADGSALFVSMPASDRVAVLNTVSFRVAVEIEVGPRPAKMLLQPDESYLWVAPGEGTPADRSEITVISTHAPEVRRVTRGPGSAAPPGATGAPESAAHNPNSMIAARIPVGTGPHDLAVSDDNRTAFITNGGSGTVTVVDVQSLRVAAELPTGRSPGRVAWSKAARAAYVTDATDGTVTVIDGDKRTITTRIPVAPGEGGIAFERKGRFGFVWNTETDQLSILDAARGQIVQTGRMDDGPDQVTFSDTIAYVRHRSTDNVLMIPLDQIGAPDKPIAVADFPGGEKAPGPAPLADAIVQAAGEAAVLVANPADKVVYFYKEGMAAPMGNFQGYGHVPKAVKVLDRGLVEKAPGVYGTTARLLAGGPHDVVFFLDLPRLAVCFPLDVAEGEAAPPDRTTVESLLGDTVVPPGEEVKLEVRLSNAGTKAPRDGLSDVRMLAVLPPGVWHTRGPAEAAGEGVYVFRFNPPQPGLYDVRVESAAAGLAFRTSPPVLVRVESKGGSQ